MLLPWATRGSKDYNREQSVYNGLIASTIFGYPNLTALRFPLLHVTLAVGRRSVRHRDNHPRSEDSVGGFVCDRNLGLRAEEKERNAAIHRDRSLGS
jgi:hypothetical protein